MMIQGWIQELITKGEWGAQEYEYTCDYEGRKGMHKSIALCIKAHEGRTKGGAHAPRPPLGSATVIISICT